MNKLPFSYRLKNGIVRIGFFLLGRALQSLSRYDSEVIEEIAAWREGFTFGFQVREARPAIYLRKIGTQIRYLGKKNPGSCDLTVVFKNIQAAFMLITTGIGVSQAYSQHRIGVIGNVSDSMILIRCLNVVEQLLFPRFLAKRIIRNLPPMNIRRHLLRAYVYLLGIPFGL